MLPSFDPENPNPAAARDLLSRVERKSTDPATAYTLAVTELQENLAVHRARGVAMRDAYVFALDATYYVVSHDTQGQAACECLGAAMYLRVLWHPVEGVRVVASEAAGTPVLAMVGSALN